MDFRNFIATPWGGDKREQLFNHFYSPNSPFLQLFLQTSQCVCWMWRLCNFLLLILWHPDENLSYKGCWVSYQLLTILLYSGCSKPLDNSQLCVWLSREGDMKWLIQKQQRKIDSASPILKDWRPSLCSYVPLVHEKFLSKRKDDRSYWGYFSNTT